MSWDRAQVSAALVDVLGPATGVTVHPAPPETLNPMCIVVGRPQPVAYSTVGFDIDEATLPLVIVGGVETEDRIESLKTVCRDTLRADPTLGAQVPNCYPTEERNWRNVTGAGGIQLLLVDLILTVQM
ncbi:MAG TPA: hypothetical protein VGH66_14000 [Acidimicrobiales bacterium]|jgi:hypothetical protein